MAEVRPDSDAAGRPGEGASAESRLEELQRRHALLRQDYERLLARLTSLESRLGTTDPAAGPAPSLREQLRAPLAALRDEYRQAMDDLAGLVDGLDQLLGGRMKGQRGRDTGNTPLRTLRVVVPGPAAGEVLDFEEAIAGLPGVARVSVEAVERDRATFTVELARDE